MAEEKMLNTGGLSFSNTLQFALIIYFGIFQALKAVPVKIFHIRYMEAMFRSRNEKSVLDTLIK